MNIREAKEEIIRTVRAYTAKDDRGCGRIPSVRQRPVLLIGPPGKGFWLIRLHIIRDRVRLDCRSL